MVEQVRQPIWAKNWSVYAICLVVAFCFLLVCSSNSFLYGMNDWVDCNWYITMGNGVLEGKVPYRDMFEQKGPLTYFVFAFLCLFPNVYRAVFALEIITLSIFLFLAYKIMTRYISPYLSIIGTVILALLVSTCAYFGAGGGALEEYSLPIQAHFILLLLKVLDGEKIKKSQSILIGALVAVLFWMKYTMILIPACVLVIWLILTIKNREYKQLFNILFMLLGFAIVTLPIFIYYVANSAIKDLFISYFYNNIFLYKSKSRFGRNLFYLLIQGIFPFILMILGFVFLKQKIGKKAWLYTIPMIALIFSLLAMQSYIYYFLPILVFSILGVVFILTKCSKIESGKVSRIVSMILLPILCIGSTFIFANNNSEMGKSRAEYAQYAIAEDIKSFGYDNPSLFCYKLMDYGIYNACEIVPSERFYALNNFSEEEFPEMYESFEVAIIEKRNDFVVVEKYTYVEEKEFLEQYYDFYKSYVYKYIENDTYSHNFKLVLLIKST